MFNIVEDLMLVKKYEVMDAHSAVKLGSGSLKVLGTPALVAFMENTSKECVEFEMPLEYTTVGIEMKVKHLKASKVGSVIKCKAVLNKIDGKKLFFFVEAWDGDIKVGEAEHTRYIVKGEEFMNKL